MTTCQTVEGMYCFSVTNRNYQRIALDDYPSTK